MSYNQRSLAQLWPSPDSWPSPYLGIAELFLVSQNEEKLFARKRKGFIKLALRTGAEIVPAYFMGQPAVLLVLVLTLALALTMTLTLTRQHLRPLGAQRQTAALDRARDGRDAHVVLGMGRLARATAQQGARQSPAARFQPPIPWPPMIFHGPSTTFQVLGIVGRPLGIPTTPIAEPTAEQIDMYHERYLAEVQRLFDTYKRYNPDYKDKTLQFE